MCTQVLCRNTCEFVKVRLVHLTLSFVLSPILINITMCLLDRTHHVVAVQTVTKEEFRSSQTHEFEAIRKILPAVQAKGTKGVPKAIQKWEGKRWFAELSDKQASVKRHFYFSMKYCTSPDDLKKRLLAVLDHYQANHNSCDPESKCKIPGYHCSKVKLTNPRAIAALRKFILDSKVYKLAEDYYQCRDTYWVVIFQQHHPHLLSKANPLRRPHFQHAHGTGSYGLERKCQQRSNICELNSRCAPTKL